MKLFDRMFRRFGYVKANTRRRPIHVSMGTRGYNAATSSRLTADIIASSVTEDTIAHGAIEILRNRARDLVRNDDYAKKFMRLCEVNVVGPRGFILNVDATDARWNTELSQFEYVSDNAANDIIENAFKVFSKPKNFLITKNMSRRVFEQTAIKTIARDGETLIRLIKGDAADNDFGFALQPLEAEQLDHNLNKQLENGNTIRMGVETNRYRLPVAYWLFDGNPNDYLTYGVNRTRYERVPASDIIHAFLPDFFQQTRGMTWFHAAMGRLSLLNGYEDAELIAARAAASKMGFFQKGVDVKDQYEGDAKDENGNLIDEFEPGTITDLPPGYTFEKWDPSHPHTNFADFRKSILRGISAGLAVNYNSLASDLEGVNYSSIRAGVLEERDVWMLIQAWFTEMVLERIYEEWLNMAMLTGAVNLPMTKFSKFTGTAVMFKGRTWQWVDPLKDISASEKSVALRVKSRSAVISESDGSDFEEVARQIDRERRIADRYGISLDDPKRASPTSESPPVTDEPDDEEEDEDEDLPSRVARNGKEAE